MAPDTLPGEGSPPSGGNPCFKWQRLPCAVQLAQLALATQAVQQSSGSSTAIVMNDSAEWKAVPLRTAGQAGGAAEASASAQTDTGSMAGDC